MQTVPFIRADVLKGMSLLFKSLVSQRDSISVLTILVLLLLALPASLLLLVENTLGLGCLLQARHESLHVSKTVVQNLLMKV